jgi:hypothetical protein|tara:strand:+ start:398 stop:580 length:183 start_codon:yes stop_codon:yes gene_type:complete
MSWQRKVVELLAEKERAAKDLKWHRAQVRKMSAKVRQIGRELKEADDKAGYEARANREGA